MLFKEIITVYTGNHTKPTNTKYNVTDPFIKMKMEKDGSNSGSLLMVGFGISCVECLGCPTMFVMCKIRQIKEFHRTLTDNPSNKICFISVPYNTFLSTLPYKIITHKYLYALHVTLCVLIHLVMKFLLDNTLNCHLLHLHQLQIFPLALSFSYTV
jgi:hypothetical protein